MDDSNSWKAGEQPLLTNNGVTLECRSENHFPVVAVFSQKVTLSHVHAGGDSWPVRLPTIQRSNRRLSGANRTSIICQPSKHCTGKQECFESREVAAQVSELTGNTHNEALKVLQDRTDQILPRLCRPHLRTRSKKVIR